MTDRRTRASTVSRFIALFAIVASIFAGSMAPAPVTAQAAPLLTINGHPTGPIVTWYRISVAVQISGLTPNQNFTMSEYSGAGCVHFLGNGPNPADANGVYAAPVSYQGAQTISYRATDSILGESNCVTVIATENQTPTIAINGDQYGPVNLLSGTDANFYVTGLSTNSIFTLSVFSDPHCSVGGGDFSYSSNANGEHTGTVPGVTTGITSYRAMDSVTGISNCITMRVTDIGPPVLSINGDATGPVHVSSGSSAAFHITSLTPNTNFTLNAYNGTTCSTYAYGGPNPADANGEFSASAPFDGAQTVSFQAFDSNGNVSNCLTVIVDPPPAPVLAINGDSVGPVDVASGSSAAFTITGLTPNSTFTLNVYNGTDCTVYADGGPNAADGEGEFNASAPYGGPQTVSYQAVDTVAGASNCVAVIVTDQQSPTPTMTPTVEPTATATPTETPTVTPTTEAPTTPTVTPTVEPTTTPEPMPDTALSITGDPRFAITGQISISGFGGLTFTLNTPPAVGGVIVQPNGSFTYTASPTMATSDSFTVLATAANGDTAFVTVTITFVIDPTVPTYGTVSRGPTGYGGNPDDARTPGRANPTAVPSDNEDDDEDLDPR